VRELLPGIDERNYAKVPLTADEVREIVAAAGSVAKVLNTTHATAKERGWKASPPPVDEFVAAVLQEPNLLRRPIVVKDGRVVVGKDEAGWKSLT
jgi:arsenate reductase-like glutaredoxin family protein